MKKRGEIIGAANDCYGKGLDAVEQYEAGRVKVEKGLGREENVRLQEILDEVGEARQKLL